MAFSEFSIRRRTRQARIDVLQALPEDAGRQFRLGVASERRGEGHWYHTIRHESMTEALADRSATYFAEIDFPCALGPLEVLDPFVMAFAFHQMTIGGVLEVDGPVSRRLLHNLCDVQAQSHNRWPERYRPFAIEPRAIVEAPYGGPRRRDGIIAITGGLDSTLSLYRQTDPALAQRRRPLGMATTVMGYNPPQHRVAADFEPRQIERMQRLAGKRGLPLGVIRCDFGRIRGNVIRPHGAVFGGLFALAAAEFPFAVLASSAPNGDHWLYRGSGAEWQWSYGTGGFDLASDLGLFTRAERVALLAAYGADVCDDLIVCGNAENLPESCGRCAKCVRTMLTFEAAGLPIPRCFPCPIDPSLIGYGGSDDPETGYHTEILRLAAAYGTDTPNLRILKRRYLRKTLKRKVLSFARALRWD